MALSNLEMCHIWIFLDYILLISIDRKTWKYVNRKKNPSADVVTVTRYQ